MNHEHDHPHSPPPAPAAPVVDSGSQALAEALQSSFAIVKYVMVGLFVVFLFSGMFKVEPQEKAIILRFGRPVGEGEQALRGSGLHWAWPYPIDEVIKIPIAEIQKAVAKNAWFFQTAQQEALNQDPPHGLSLNPEVDGYALTGDGNIVHAQATLSYRIEDPVRCVFEFASGTNTGFGLAGISNAVVNALDSALVHTIARYKMDDLLLSDVAGFQHAVALRMGELVVEQKLGIVVDQCIVRTREPRQVKDVFANVGSADTRRNTMLSEASNYTNRVLSQASADATNRLNQAETDRARNVQEITSFAANFREFLPRYEANPDLFIQQRLVETMSRVFANATDKMLLPAGTAGEPVELRLLLNREPPKPETETPRP